MIVIEINEITNSSVLDPVSTSPPPLTPCASLKSAPPWHPGQAAGLPGRPNQEPVAWSDRDFQGPAGSPTPHLPVREMACTSAGSVRGAGPARQRARPQSSDEPARRSPGRGGPQPGTDPSHWHSAITAGPLRTPTPWRRPVGPGQVPEPARGEKGAAQPRASDAPAPGRSGRAAAAMPLCRLRVDPSGP